MKAYEKQINLYNSKIEKIQQYLSGIKEVTNQNLENHSEFKGQFEKTKDLIANTFKTIRTLIDE